LITVTVGFASPFTASCNAVVISGSWDQGFENNRKDSRVAVALVQKQQRQLDLSPYVLGNGRGNCKNNQGKARVTPKNTWARAPGWET